MFSILASHRNEPDKILVNLSIGSIARSNARVFAASC
jgi:hypothetical protein